MTDSQQTDEKVASLLLRWEESWNLGTDVPAHDLCADCPELVEKLEERIAVLKKMEWMNDPMVEEGDVSEEADSLIGETLSDRYRIEQLIGEGGFGRVYRAFDPELERHVAIKVAKPKQTPADQASILLEEARRAAQLRHPGIVSVHDVGRHDAQVYFVSDLIDGHSLAEVIDERQLNPTEAVRLISVVADALQFAHDQGFVHRDVKPANILVDQQGQPLIADFGIAATMEQIGEGSVTSGTLPYMAPEQVAGEIQLIDGRTDIHALGVILYELLTGRLPYQARTPTALREQILLRQPKPPRAINPDVPSLIEDVCLRALAKHPADRFANAHEMAMALRSALSAKSKSGQWAWLGVVGGVVLILTALVFTIGPNWWGGSASNTKTERSAEQTEGVLFFDGTNRILTPVERFGPATLEAWIRPERYEDRCHYVVASDVPSEWGISIGVCGVILSAERIEGLVKSKQIVPVRQWSHIAAVFSEKETRLYFNGKLVHTGPATKIVGGTHFVVGNAGENHPREYFLGEIRCLRISRGERYEANFTPEERFTKDAHDSPARAVLIYEGRTVVDGGRVVDVSGNGNDGRWSQNEMR